MTFHLQIFQYAFLPFVVNQCNKREYICMKYINNNLSKKKKIFSIFIFNFLDVNNVFLILHYINLSIYKTVL